MSFRTFEINVGKSSILPAVISNAGYQGEHNATELSFKLDSDVISALTKEQTNGKKLYYRFDAYDGAGGKNSTEPKEVVSLSTSYIYVLENWITKSGINLKVNLIFTAVKDNETEVEVFSGAVQLQLKNSPEGEDISGENNESLSSLCVATQKYAERAENAEQSATASEQVCTESAERAEEAKRSATASEEACAEAAENTAALRAETQEYAEQAEKAKLSATASEEACTEAAENTAAFRAEAQEYAEQAEKAKLSATTSEETCTEAAEKTVEARLALEEGVVWIFDGGTAEVAVEEKITIDSVMSDESKNPVENKVTKKYIDDKINTLYDEPVSIENGGTGATTTEEALENLGVPGLLDEKITEVNDRIKRTEEEYANLEEDFANLYNEPVSIENGGTGASDPANARQNLGIAAAISSFSLGALSGGRLAHEFEIDNELKCVVGRSQVEATFTDSANVGSLYSCVVDIPLSSIMPSTMQQVIISVYYGQRPMWCQVSGYDSSKITVRLISTGNGACSPYIHYMIVGKK